MNTRIAETTYEDALLIASIAKASERQALKVVAIGNIAGIMSGDDAFIGVAEEDGVGLGAIMCRVHHGIFLTMGLSLTRKDAEGKRNILASIVGHCLIKAKAMGAVMSTVGLCEKSDHCDDMKAALEDNGYRTQHVFEENMLQRNLMDVLGISGDSPWNSDEDSSPPKNYVMSIQLADERTCFERYLEAAKRIRSERPYRSIDTSMAPSALFGEFF